MRMFGPAGNPYAYASNPRGLDFASGLFVTSAFCGGLGSHPCSDRPCSFAALLIIGGSADNRLAALTKLRYFVISKELKNFCCTAA
jgi:hypothetical protein